MAGIAPFRCPNIACRVVLLVSDRGRVRAVVPADLIGVDKGDPVVRCGECGERATWRREAVHPV